MVIGVLRVLRATAHFHVCVQNSRAALCHERLLVVCPTRCVVELPLLAFRRERVLWRTCY